MDDSQQHVGMGICACVSLRSTQDCTDVLVILVLIFCSLVTMQHIHLIKMKDNGKLVNRSKGNKYGPDHHSLG